MKKTLLIALLVTSYIQADPLITYPGTKAKGMGGAFTAIANNNSAMYFNPAGLVSFDGKEYGLATMEFGNGAKIVESANTIENKYDSTGSYFLGVAKISNDNGYGFSMYTLYNIDSTNSVGGMPLNEEIQVLSLSYAHTLIDQIYPYGGKFAIGASFAYASTLGGSSDNSSSSETMDASGYFAMVGVKYRVIDTMSFKFDLGANYRSYGELTSNDEYSSVTITGVGIPAEIAYGAALSYGTSFGLFTAALDSRDTGYNEATKDSNLDIRIPDTHTLSLGLDYSNSLVQLRAGTYKTVYNASDETRFNVNGIAFGMGYVIAAKKTMFMNIEIAVDKRTYTEYGESTDETFASFSFNYSWSE